MNRFFDLDHPFFRPLWIRVSVTALCALWAALEFVAGSPGWGVAMGALALYCGYRFFIAFAPREKP